MHLYCGVVVNNESVQVDRIFTYKIPLELLGKVRIGHRVKVPFGKGNRAIDGFVMELYEQCEAEAKLKEILNICDEIPLLKRSDVELIKSMKLKYLCTYLECIKVFIPSGITRGVKEKKQLVLYVGKRLEGRHDKEGYREIYNRVISAEGEFGKSELAAKFKVSLSSINTMIKYGYLILKEKTVYRYSTREYKKYENKQLTVLQQEAVNTISGEGNKFLLHGVTGSGKTEIYMNIAQKTIDQGKEGIILVPEISLTPQMVERFKGRFGNNIAVFHSRLSQGERFDEWMRVKRGEVKLAVGARSALFLPFNNLGVIIIDEEHEGSYKSDSDPKYHAVEIAFLKSELENCKVILGSATPSVETYFKFRENKWSIIELNRRVDGCEMPIVELADMREELLNNNRSIFSRKLFLEIEEALKKGEQIILFLNRRGFSTFVSCRNCGYVFKCQNCDISLTYHMGTDILECHYCGGKARVSRNCPSCGSKYVKYFGVGTEKVQQEIMKYFPSARTLRMDFDTTRKKNAHEQIYNMFKEHRADILVGTQMVAKGLDFENVTVVGVIAADLSLNLPDFRANERTFQLITQVSGRAGRGKKRGKVIVQTYNPDNFSIVCAQENDYKKFYNEEILLREAMRYPPYGKLMTINLSSEDEGVLIKKISELGVVLKNNLRECKGVVVLGPCPCGISKIKRLYRWQIIVKGYITLDIANNIKELTYSILKGYTSMIKTGIDLNPYNVL